MTDFSNVELRRLDLTLLLVFLGLLHHRKATRVAADLGLTQSAVSQALKRLRQIFGDELFLRRPHGLDPTAVALALEAPVRAAVEALRGVLGGFRTFDPATAEGVIRIAALDSEQAGLVPGLVGALAAAAPGLQLAVLPLARAAAMEALAAGQIDIALGFFWDLPESLIAMRLYEQRFLVVGRLGVIGDGPITLARYAALPHVLVSPGGDLRGVVDEALASEGLTRRVIAAVPQFFPALVTVAQTDSIVSIPDRLARRYAPILGLRAVEPPLPLRAFWVSALRHRRNARDGRILWMLDLIDRVAKGADAR
ncbi:MAG: LysR substrate-binding domain-containing protein [Rhodobacterales bacterium]|nr:LysR substrate-binding domain-containing protein [Rhodobacterales bacterium]